MPREQHISTSCYRARANQLPPQKTFPVENIIVGKNQRASDSANGLWESSRMAKKLLLKKLPERFILASLQLGPGLKQRSQSRLDHIQICGPKVLSNREEVRGYLGENVAWGQNNSLSLALERNRIGIVGPNEISFAIEL